MEGRSERVRRMEKEIVSIFWYVIAMLKNYNMNLMLFIEKQKVLYYTCLKHFLKVSYCVLKPQYLKVFVIAILKSD